MKRVPLNFAERVWIGLSAAVEELYPLSVQVFGRLGNDNVHAPQVDHRQGHENAW